MVVKLSKMMDLLEFLQTRMSQQAKLLILVEVESIFHDAIILFHLVLRPSNANSFLPLVDYGASWLLASLEPAVL